MERLGKKDVDPELLERIKSQIEFYFGDINLPRDKFMQRVITYDNGFIPMTTMLKFKMLAAMTTDVETILTAISDSDLIEISKDRRRIRRSLARPL